ncbi:hypothetical protein F5Y10DRAFT_180256 [Nemania abortiva]|nr:hypothetical protein F5Y10DRAFT_180256 [Nemania abortiva]
MNIELRGDRREMYLFNDKDRDETEDSYAEVLEMKGIKYHEKLRQELVSLTANWALQRLHSVLSSIVDPVDWLFRLSVVSYSGHAILQHTRQIGYMIRPKRTQHDTRPSKDFHSRISAQVGVRCRSKSAKSIALLAAAPLACVRLNGISRQMMQREINHGITSVRGINSIRLASAMQYNMCFSIDRSRPVVENECESSGLTQEPTRTQHVLCCVGGTAGREGAETPSVCKSVCKSNLGLVWTIFCLSVWLAVCPPMERTASA